MVSLLNTTNNSNGNVVLVALKKCIYLYNTTCLIILCVLFNMNVLFNAIVTRKNKYIIIIIIVIIIYYY